MIVRIKQPNVTTECASKTNKCESKTSENSGKHFRMCEAGECESKSSE